MRPRIRFEETTPLHKQGNCGGVRASVDQGEIERERDRGGCFYHQCDRTTSLGEEATKEEISSFAFVLRIRIVGVFVRRLPLSGSECAHACVRVSRTPTISSRGANMRTRTPPVYRTCSHIALCEPGILTTSASGARQRRFSRSRLD